MSGADGGAWEQDGAAAYYRPPPHLPPVPVAITPPHIPVVRPASRLGRGGYVFLAADGGHAAGGVGRSECGARRAAGGVGGLECGARCAGVGRDSGQAELPSSGGGGSHQ